MISHKQSVLNQIMFLSFASTVFNYVSLCQYVHVNAGAYGGQRRESLPVS